MPRCLLSEVTVHVHFQNRPRLADRRRIPKIPQRLQRKQRPINATVIGHVDLAVRADTGTYLLAAIPILERENCGFRKFWHVNSGNSGTVRTRRQDLFQVEMTCPPGGSVERNEASSF